ncbi:MAG: hypothetical protein KGZ96_07320 [Clostridia bacterium]|nr:hypothetical protein [Clostridia bacterium]
MSRRSFKVILLSICFTLLLSAGIVAANYEPIVTNYTSILQKYLVKDELALNNDIKKLTKEQLINEIDVFSTTFEEANNNNILIPFVEQLFQRKNEIGDLEIINNIKDTTRTLTTREIMVDLYIVKHENDINKHNEIKKLLQEESIDKNIKARIVSTARFTKNDVELLKGIIEEDDGILAFHSMKKLTKIDPQKAYEISREILLNTNSQSKDRVSAALRSTAFFLRNDVSNSQNYEILETDFINLCLDIIYSSDDLFLKDSAVFAISEIGSKKSISTIIEIEFIDRELKVFAIDQNYLKLKEILLNNPVEKEIEIVVKAMELMPILDLVEGLEKVTKNIEDNNLKQRSEDVLKNMRAHGIKGNQKWLGQK